MESLREGVDPLEKTLNAKELIGISVISQEGDPFWKVAHVRINPSAMHIDLFLISRGIFREPWYVGRTYIEKISAASIILTIQPLMLLKGKRVVDAEGKVLGKIKEIARNGDANVLKSIIVKHFFKKEFSLPASAIESAGKSVLLKKSYGEKTQFRK